MQKENSKVTVIIPVYKVEKYLDECVQSVLNQTYKNLEIILVDDGSPDDCPQMCDEYAKRDDRVIVIHKPNGGQASARNIGIEIATGEYLFFVDSDDYVSKDIVEILLRGLKEKNAEIAVCRYTADKSRLDGIRSRKMKIYSAKTALKNLLKEKKITTSPCVKLFSARLFKGIAYPEGKIHEDLGTIYKVVDRAKTIVFIDKYKYYYRYNPESTTRSTFTRKQLDYFDIIASVQAYLKEHHPRFLYLAINHETRNCIAFMRRISLCGLDDQELVAFLTKKTRKNILGYLFSSYSLLSKLYGLLISVSPKLALKVFKKKN